MTSATDRCQQPAGLPLPGGCPTEETARALEGELFFQRAVQAYLWALPAANACAMRDGLGAAFGSGDHVISVFEKRLKPGTHAAEPHTGNSPAPLVMPG
jgi:hypothetical protein